MDYSPPPLFKQGASARAKLGIFALIAIVLLLVDARLNTLDRIRQIVGTALYPLQVVALLPRDAAYAVGSYFSTVTALQHENADLRRQQLVDAQSLQRMQQLLAENAQLRKLLAANERLPVKSIMSEILYDARDPFTRKLVVDRGARHGVVAGQPVIDEAGVLGQITRVFAYTSEVTLLTDKDQAIPVQVVRTGLRSVAYGKGHSGMLDLRFMPVNADVRNDDVVVTSGIDGVYPPGLAVAKVEQVESKSSDAFARIQLQPLAGIDRNRQLLILLQQAAAQPALEGEEGTAAPPKAGTAGKPVAESGKAVKTSAKEAAAVKEASKAPAKASAPPAAPAAARKPANPGSAPAAGAAAPQATVEVSPAAAASAQKRPAQ